MFTQVILGRMGLFKWSMLAWSHSDLIYLLFTYCWFLISVCNSEFSGCDRNLMVQEAVTIYCVVLTDISVNVPVGKVNVAFYRSSPALPWIDCYSRYVKLYLLSWDSCYVVANRLFCSRLWVCPSKWNPWPHMEGYVWSIKKSSSLSMVQCNVLCQMENT